MSHNIRDCRWIGPFVFGAMILAATMLVACGGRIESGHEGKTPQGEMEAGDSSLVESTAPSISTTSPVDWKWENPYPQGNPLIDIWGSSSTDVFSVGTAGTILHYDGKAWSKMTTPTTNELLGVWGSSSSDVFVVGGEGTILRKDH
jgi:hypothetical protein